MGYLNKQGITTKRNIKLYSVGCEAPWSLSHRLYRLSKLTNDCSESFDAIVQHRHSLGLVSCRDPAWATVSTHNCAYSLSSSAAIYSIAQV